MKEKIRENKIEQRQTKTDVHLEVRKIKKINNRAGINWKTKSNTYKLNSHRSPASNIEKSVLYTGGDEGWVESEAPASQVRHRCRHRRCSTNEGECNSQEGPRRTNKKN